jgi:hypothetical protein
MREARWKTLLRKSISACVAAIEVYNKPVMAHRDETFAMLAINAWELLLKARLVRHANNDLRAIQVLVPVLGRDGKPTRRKRVERNRSGNPKTITLGEAVNRVSNSERQKLDPACAANLWSLVEIRDNAVHFVNTDPEMARRVHEVGCACLRNYAAAVAEWFDQDLSEHRFMILPLSFDGAGSEASVVPGRRSRQAANLMTYLDQASDAHPTSGGSQYAAALRVETRIVGGRVRDAIAVRLSSGPEVPKVELTEADIVDRYPLDYAELQKRAKARLPNLRFNRAFNEAMRGLKGDARYVFRRRLDPRKPRSPWKDFFSHAAADALVRALDPPKTSAPPPI